jgi:hypothetical protein
VVFPSQQLSDLGIVLAKLSPVCHHCPCKYDTSIELCPTKGDLAGQGSLSFGRQFFVDHFQSLGAATGLSIVRDSGQTMLHHQLHTETN